MAIYEATIRPYNQVSLRNFPNRKLAVEAFQWTHYGQVEQIVNIQPSGRRVVVYKRKPT